jgi:hypothetical protein
MNKIFSLPLIAALLAACAPGVDQAGDTTRPTELRHRSVGTAPIEEFHGVEGRCTSFRLRGQDMTHGCLGILMFATNAAGRITTAFTFQPGSMITIAGYDLPNPGPNIDAFEVDMFTLNLNIPGVPATRSAATGRCTYTNPYAGPFIVRCSARLANGEPLEASFRSDTFRP